MENKYELPQDPEEDTLEETAFSYQTQKLPCQLSQEQLRMQIVEGIEDMKNGLGRTSEELLEKYKNRTI